MKWLAEKILKLRGWQFVGDLPAVQKLVIVGAPHTSNWDFVLFLGAISHWDIRPNFIGKHSLFKWPFGYLFRHWGGIPVDRTRASGIVKQVKDAFDQAKDMVLAMAPEGTRGAAPHWKGGFLSIARTANVPVLMVGVDGPSRRVTMGPLLDPSGSTKEFMDRAREFFAEMPGLRPKLKGPVRLKTEQE